MTDKTPRQFRNALYQYFVDNDVTKETASTVASEAELYAAMFEAYKLRDIAYAARIAGFSMADDVSLCPACNCMTKTIHRQCGKCKENKEGC